ncbi:hypothetical protein ATO6_02135 [Oceanicola sp. 22II-s10i]|uniref:CapA family protein n=1 Tax=Oceanicola sp. 22II-s10i TaxID=1317116 RepID=UPI000B52799F|nr:CapA family protein [Oceanicola sp. 22II-s10i]OWU85737.1 hypothetical protein ATO6_02135 [Oceanicola sp. 22II-s10i]
MTHSDTLPPRSASGFRRPRPRARLAPRETTRPLPEALPPLTVDDLPRSLPFAPKDTLQVGSPPLRLVIKTVTGLSERFRWWRTPLTSAATATEEMGPLDNLYWIHKSKYPVCQMPGGADPDSRLDRNYRGVSLPQGLVPERTLTLGACGDMLRSPGIDGSQDILFEKVADDLFGQDLAFANFESPVTTQPLVDEVIGDAGPPVECCSREQFDIFKGHRGRNFDMLHTANNHMFDMGVEGIESTQSALAEEGIANLGTLRSPAQHGRAVIVDRNDIRIGFVSDCFGLNGRVMPEDERWRIHVSKLLSKKQPPDLSLLKRQIDDARAQNCDFIIASVHWGWEFELFPREVQIAAAHELVEYGADSLICHHPHVIQPVEVYRTERDPARVAVIAHSLGSLTWAFMAPHIVLSTILKLRLAKGYFEGDLVTFIAGVDAVPVFRTYVEEEGHMITRIEKLTDHVGRQDSLFPQEYVGQIAAHAEHVLGPDCMRRPKG